MRAMTRIMNLRSNHGRPRELERGRGRVRGPGRESAASYARLLRLLDHAVHGLTHNLLDCKPPLFWVPIVDLEAAGDSLIK
jgi:hypothetical protein